MELEFHQLDRRYERLRKAHPKREKRLLASLAEFEQLSPVIVVDGQDGRSILLDGYKRVRALERLRRDTVVALRWDLPEADALMLERLMRDTADGPIEQGWLLKELRDRFELSTRELARRFDRSQSWVSRRLGLVAELPEPIQEQVRRGHIVAHGAAKFLVPLARANPQSCVRLSAAIAPLGLSTRQMGELYGALLGGTARTRELVLSDPALFLRAQQEARRAQPLDKRPAEQLLGELGAIGGMARKVVRRLREGIAARLSLSERDEVARCMRQAQADMEQLLSRWAKEAWR